MATNTAVTSTVATETMEQTEATPNEKPQNPKRQVEISVSEIITNARSAPPPAIGSLALSLLTGLILWASFPPLDWGAFGWLALVPLTMLIQIPQPTRWMSASVYAGGLLFTVASLQWMRLGDPLMFIAWFALAAYVAAYFPLFVKISRIGVHKLKIPLVCVVPVVWVGLEYVRAYLLTGFSWYYLGHTQYLWTNIIQISDLTGAYGVSFLIATMSACLGLLVPHRVYQKLRLLPQTASQTASNEANSAEGEAAHLMQAGAFHGGKLGNHQLVSIVVGGVLFAACFGYGVFRRSQAQFTAGPRVALIQGKFIASLRQPTASAAEIYSKHDVLTGRAVREQPDLIIWPEQMFRWPLAEAPIGMSDFELDNVAPMHSARFWKDTTTRDALQDLSQRAGAAMIIGLDRYEINPASQQISHFNSAVMIHPDTGIQKTYDKKHLVPFGEYLPLKDTLPIFSSLTPIATQGGLSFGTKETTFQYRDWTFTPIICFEDTVPHVVRQAAASSFKKTGKPSDVLVAMTNDGWFHGSSEHDQHLISSLFRAVELRTPLVRSANMGISAIIDGDGVIREPDVLIDGEKNEGSKNRKTSIRDPKTGKLYRDFEGILVADVPLDSRSSLYRQWGDWFPGGCCIMMVFGCLVGFVVPSVKP